MRISTTCPYVEPKCSGGCEIEGCVSLYLEPATPSYFGGYREWRYKPAYYYLLGEDQHGRHRHHRRIKTSREAFRRFEKIKREGWPTKRRVEI